MSPRVTYWTGTWAPRKEANSKEVDLLRSLGGRPRLVVSLSRGQGTRISRHDRVLQLSVAQWPLLRLLSPLIERAGAISHVFGGLDSWHLLRAVGSRPVVLTVTLPGAPASAEICAHVSRFVVESESLADDLRGFGVPDERIALIYPGVDLHHYRPGLPPPHQPFRILFASSPSDPAEFQARGVALLVETARLCPDLEVMMLWRQWGDQSAARVALHALAPPPNVKVLALDASDMAPVYRSAHAVACLYEPGFGKSCPNSIIEGMACGVPALVSDSCGIAGLIDRTGSGIVTARTPAAVAAAAQALRRAHGEHVRAARFTAEQHFDVRNFLAAYVRVYEETLAMATNRGRTAPPALRLRLRTESPR